MAMFRIHRIKDPAREQFRWQPHVSGQAVIRPKDYQPGGEVNAANVFAAWKQLRDAGSPLVPGDVLEDEQNRLTLSKYTGFDAAVWHVPEPHHQPSQFRSE